MAPSSKIICGVAPGIYTLSVLDSMRCSATASFNVLPATSTLTVSPTVKHPSCGGTNGSIALAISGEAAPYQVQWADGSTGTTFSGPKGTIAHKSRMRTAVRPGKLLSSLKAIPSTAISFHITQDVRKTTPAVSTCVYMEV